MNYYEKLLKEIEDKISCKKFSEALQMVEEELSLPYVPMDVEKKLKEYLEDIKPNIQSVKTTLSDEQIFDYLKGDQQQQLIGVSALRKKNLREYLNEIEEYLVSDAFINAKVLLVDGLIEQEINTEIKMLNQGLEYSFIPKYVIPVDMSDGFIEANRILYDIYMKEPSKYEMAKQLLFKELMLMLPVNAEKEEGKLLADRISEYIDSAFD